MLRGEICALWFFGANVHIMIYRDIINVGASLNKYNYTISNKETENMFWNKAYDIKTMRCVSIVDKNDVSGY